MDLGENRIGDEGARALVGALKINKMLTSLNLSGNIIGEEGARVIAQAAEKHHADLD